MKRFFPYDVFGRLAMNIKMAEKERKIQPTAVPLRCTMYHVTSALYHDDAPRDFGPRFAYASWRWFSAAFRYLVPDKTVRERKVGP